MPNSTQVDSSWEAQVSAAWQEFADGRLGEDIADDARRFCPVRTGALKASIEHHMEEDTLIVSASGGGEDSDGNLFVYRRPGRLSSQSAGLTHPNPGRNVGSLTTREVHHVVLEADQLEHEGHAASGGGSRTYAAYVELGHRVYHPSTKTTGPEMVEPRPFLQPALYQTRSER
jgi:hypothetical protein